MSKASLVQELSGYSTPNQNSKITHKSHLNPPITVFDAVRKRNHLRFQNSYKPSILTPNINSTTTNSPTQLEGKKT